MFIVWLCQYLFGGLVQVVFIGEDYGDGFVQVLVMYFGVLVCYEWFECVLDVGQVCGIELCVDLYVYCYGFVLEVYVGYVQCVVFIGGEFSGKIMLVWVMVECLQIVWVLEYGCMLWEQ